MNNLVCVYQDCPTCGNRKNWGEKTIARAKQSGLDIKFVSFASPEGANLCKQAIYSGIAHLPFITNGQKFSNNIDDFVAKPKAKRTRKTKKVEVKDNGISE